MSLRLLYDAVNVKNIPPTATMVAGYLSGATIPTTLPALRVRFPQAQVVTIAVTAQQDAMVLDVEKGDALPTDVPGWLTRQRSQGHDPTIYCSVSPWPLVKAACAAQNVPLPWWWAASPGPAQLLPDPRCVARQYSYPGGYDISIVAAYWPGVDPLPTPKEDDMPYLIRSPDGEIDLVLAGAMVHLSPAQLPTYSNLVQYPVDQVSADKARAKCGA
jgi:hypothetical protein